MADRIPYRPSNGTEGDIFYCHWCARCKVDQPSEGIEGMCDILTDVYAYGINDDGYPVQWRQDGPSGPRCTEFDAIDDMNQPIDPGAVVRPLL